MSQSHERPHSRPAPDPDWRYTRPECNSVEPQDSASRGTMWAILVILALGATLIVALVLL